MNNSLAQIASGPLNPEEPTPLGRIGGLQASRGPEPIADPNADIKMVAKGQELIAPQQAPGPMYTKKVENVDPETGEVTTDFHGVTQEFLKQLASSVQLGQQAQEGYTRAIDLIEKKKAMLERNPILAEVGKIASLASVAYQTQGSRGRGLAPLINASGAYGLDTFGKSPEQLAIESADLGQKRLSGQIGLLNELQQGEAVAAAERSRRDALDWRNKDFKERERNKYSTNYLNAAEKGYANKEAAELVEKNLRANGMGEEEAHAIAQQGLAIADKNFQRSKISDNEIEIRATGAVVPGDSLANSMSVETAQKWVEIQKRRSAASGTGKPDYNDFAVYAHMLGMPSTDPAKLAPGQVEKVQAFREAGIGPAQAATVVDALLGDKDHPLSVTALKSIVSTMGRGGSKTKVFFFALASDKAKERGETFDVNLADRKLDMLQDFDVGRGKGSAGQQRLSLDTLLQHIGEASDAMQRLEQLTGVPIANKSIIELQKQFADNPALADYLSAMSVVKHEYELAVNGGFAPYVLDKKEADSLFRENAGPKSQMATLRRAAITLKDRWIARDHSFRRLFNGQGFPDPFSKQALHGADAVGVKVGAEAENPEIPDGAEIIYEQPFK